jgi:hypothetical protein
MGKPLTTEDVPQELQEMFRGGRLSIKPGLEIGVGFVYFPEYEGPRPTRTLRKPIVGPPAQPFAELQFALRLENDGWRAAWVYRRDELIRGWEPRERASFPPAAVALLERIRKRGGEKARCWDIFAWKDGKPHFVELSREGSSRNLREPKLRWIKAALAEGVAPSAFELVVWCGGSLKGRVLRLTSYLYDKKDRGWVECRRGKITYRGGSRGHRDIVEHYRDLGARTEADLLWIVFARNSSGITWCKLKEYADR